MSKPLACWAPFVVGDEMRTSETQVELIAAMLSAQAAFPAIAKNKQGQAGNRTFKYAPHDVILDNVRPVLLANGLLLSHSTLEHTLVTRIDHRSGEWRESYTPINKEHANLQSYGIELTYLRRYAAQLILGIITEEDTDGAGGKDRKKGVNNTQPRNENGTLRGPGVPGAGRASAEEAAKGISPIRLSELENLALDMGTMFTDGQQVQAAKGWAELTDNDEKIFLWHRLDSKLKSFIRANAKPAA